MFQLTEEQKAGVDKLIASTKNRQVPMQEMTYERSKCVLSLLLNNESELWRLAADLTPEHFEDKSHQLIFKTMKRLRDDEGRLPSIGFIQEEIAEASKNDDQMFLHIGELVAVSRSLSEAVRAPREYLRDFMREQCVKVALAKAISLVASPEEAWKHLQDEQVRYDKLGEPAVIMNYNEFKAQLPKEGVDWIINGLIASGEVSMISALPWGGKSTLLAQAMANTAQGLDWLKYPTTPAAIVYLNVDRQAEDMFDQRIMPHVADFDNFNKWLHVVPTCSLPSVLTIGYLREVVASVRKKTKQQRVWLIVDTLRSGFMSKKEDGSENDSTAMVSILTPVRELAVKEKVAITVVHHNNKHADEYAGSAAIKGMVDAFIRVRREQDSTIATVNISTRRGEIYETKVSRATDGTLEPVHPSQDEDPLEAKVKTVAKSFGTGRTPQEASKYYTDLTSEVIPERTFTNYLAKGQKAGLLELLEEPAGRRPGTYKFVGVRVRNPVFTGS